MTAPPTTLEELVVPLTEDEFLSLLRQRKLTHLRGSDPDRFRSLLDWDGLVGQIERGEYPRGLADFRVVRESKNAPAANWMVRDRTTNTNKIDLAKVEDYMADGHSLVVTPIQSYVPALATLCKSIADKLSEEIKVGVVVTTGTAGAFQLHYYPEDLIIVQVQGRKRWRIYGPPVPNPIASTCQKPPPPPETAPIFDEVLEAGDILFLPAGNWHHCENGPDRSLHLGIFCIPTACLHVVKSLLSQLVHDEMFRMPLTRFENASELAELEAYAKKCLIEKVREMTLSEFHSHPDDKENSTAAES